MKLELRDQSPRFAKAQVEDPRAAEARTRAELHAMLKHAGEIQGRSTTDFGLPAVQEQEDSTMPAAFPFPLCATRPKTCVGRALHRLQSLTIADARDQEPPPCPP